MHRFVTFIFFILLTACQDGQPDAEEASQQTSSKSEKIVTNDESAKRDLPEGYETIRQHCPDMDDATIKRILKPTSPNRPDYDFYAREYCVSHEEARRRLYASSRLRLPQVECEIIDGLPAEGLGEPVIENIMDIVSLGVKSHPDKNASYLGCDHEGPQRQDCIVEDGGYITWLVNGQRRHIKAKGGYVGVKLVRGNGVQCQ